jgi:hypothetical protein
VAVAGEARRTALGIFVMVIQVVALVNAGFRSGVEQFMVGAAAAVACGAFLIGAFVAAFVVRAVHASGTDSQVPRRPAMVAFSGAVAGQRRSSADDLGTPIRARATSAWPPATPLR